jgi:DNA-binding MarR family transcriptional regulator
MDLPDDARSRLVWGLRRVSQGIEAEKGRRLRHLGLHAAHYSLLINLVDSPGITGSELARRVGVTAQNVASLVARLEKNGLLVRRPHPRHSNVLELHLTEAGEHLVRQADEAVAQLEREVRDLVGETDVPAVHRGLANLEQGLREMDARDGETARSS